jgi:hypothetical protein
MKQIITGIFVLAAINSVVYAAEGPKEYCLAAVKYFEEGDIDGATEEATWCLESLKQIKQAKKSEAFALNVNDWIRGEVSHQEVMGLNLIETEYTKDGKTITVTHNTGGGGVMGMINQFAMQQPGKKFRVQRYTAIYTVQGDQKDVAVGLKAAGGSLNFSTLDASEEELMDFTRGFPIKQVDQ